MDASTSRVSGIGGAVVSQLKVCFENFNAPLQKKTSQLVTLLLSGYGEFF
tara:strand:+ start:422 stop:571 length:150 start_codon:yes stop_codon:yes gene_type:complete